MRLFTTIFSILLSLSVKMAATTPEHALYFLDFPISSDRETTIVNLEKINFYKLPVTLKDGTKGYYETETVTKLFGEFQGEYFDLTLFHNHNPNMISAVWLEKDTFSGWEELLDMRLKISEAIQKELGEPDFACCVMDMDEDQKVIMSDRFKNGEIPTMYSLWTFKNLIVELTADVDKLHLKLQSVYK